MDTILFLGAILPLFSITCMVMLFTLFHVALKISSPAPAALRRQVDAGE